MNKFEQNLINMNSENSTQTNPEEFLSKLHGRIQKSRQDRHTLLTGFMMILMVGILSYSQFGATTDAELYYADETEDIFETDFWTVDIDSLEIDASYTEDLAYFLLDEGDFWDTVDLLNELTNEEEITL
ncbi:MAG: hypothetical protein HOK12_07555 [Candidatus Marinimicrobia bacterium]|nr:hypothetical protein [Candidatus Neomarinimicrobiota bacterium]MBT6414201.1 hypothetical protein [Candidatus Neomarinimicrobiota bacterium]